MARSVTLGLLAALLAATWSPSDAATLQPHIAAYRLSLARGRPASSEIIEVQGGLVIEWRLACDGWLSRQRLAFVGTLEEGGNLSHDVRFSSWESKDGLRMRYSYRSYSNDELQDDFRGEASLDPADGGLAVFTSPEAREIPLPPGTVFPTTHIAEVLDHASAGERFVSHQVFDGAGFDALTQITSVIGQPRMLEPLAGEGGDPGRAWPISMAYYAMESGSDTPKFEASMLLGENGILRDTAVLDYGDFQLDATLEKIELLDRPAC